MDEWFNEFATLNLLSKDAIRDLDELGFVVIPGPVPDDQLRHLSKAYETAFRVSDVRIGSTTTRFHELVNRDPVFDEVYVFLPLLEASCRVLGRPFKLSSLLARTVHPVAAAQTLHVDFPGDTLGWSMIGFILMVDSFRNDNGATRFVPGSHRMSVVDTQMDIDAATRDRQVLACGTAGSMIVYNGAVWHGHSANGSKTPRRSIQGAFIRREGKAGFDFPGSMRSETLARISPLARYVLNLD